MKKKTLLLFLVPILVLSLTGCTKNLKDKDNKIVKNEITGQNLPSNILCRAEDPATVKLYEENGIKLEELPKCSEYKITSGGYDGIWATIFVRPLAWVIIKVGLLVKNYGLSIIIITLLIRLLLYPLTKKTAVQSENMKLAQKDLQNLEKKYLNKKDQESMMQKSQEMMIIYKKYNINPLSGCLFAFIQLPLFFAFFEAMNRLPAIFEENLLWFQLGTSPITAFSAGKFYYLIFVVLVFFSTYFSFKLNSTASMSDDQAKQMKMMSTISVVMITVASLTMSVGIQIYWIFNSTFTIVQNLLVKRRKANVK